LENAGADCLVIGANTMHRIAPEVQKAVKIPLLHIAEATATAIKNKSLKKVALLGTKFTMELDFFKQKLSENGIQTIIPAAIDRDYLHAAIYNELGKGLLLPETKARFLSIMQELQKNGAEGITSTTKFSFLICRSENLITFNVNSAILIKSLGPHK
ncbi:MAG: amino acid racemase, partial [Chitinophagaceae bacterium]